MHGDTKNNKNSEVDIVDGSAFECTGLADPGTVRPSRECCNLSFGRLCMSNSRVSDTLFNKSVLLHAHPRLSLSSLAPKLVSLQLANKRARPPVLQPGLLVTVLECLASPNDRCGQM